MLYNKKGVNSMYKIGDYVVHNGHGVCTILDETFNETDVDGESGPDLPVEIRVWPKAMTFFTNK